MCEIEYTLVRSDRKTTAIHILTDGSVEVRAPENLPAAKIEDYVQKKREWIEKHRQAMLERYPADLNPREVMYKGNMKVIRPMGENMLLFDGEYFYAPEEWSDAELKRSVVDVMKKLARNDLIPMTQRVADYMGLEPQRITITNAKTKWGSCTDGKYISLSWRLLAAPIDTIECVIMHELCHMIEMNHSPAFWALMEKWSPDWRRHRAVLARVQSWLDAYYG